MKRLVAVTLIVLSVAGSVRAQQEPRGAKVIRVACIGDSITCGHGLADHARESYPAVLGRLLGEQWQVRPFCMSGVTLLKHGTKSIWSTKEWQQAIEFQPDVVVILLGTNDTRQTDWTAHGDEFEADYRDLLEKLRAANPQVRCVLCLPPPLFRDRGKAWDTDKLLTNEIIPKIRAVAAEAELAVVDVYAACDAHERDFPDRVHPNAAGVKVIARAVRDELTRDSTKASTP